MKRLERFAHKLDKAIEDSLYHNVGLIAPFILLMGIIIGSVVWGCAFPWCG
jgi:type II secretory pathway component PulF